MAHWLASILINVGTPGTWYQLDLWVPTWLIGIIWLILHLLGTQMPCSPAASEEDTEIEKYSIPILREKHAIFWNCQVIRAYRYTVSLRTYQQIYLGLFQSTFSYDDDQNNPIISNWWMLLNLQDGGLLQRLIVVSFPFSVPCTGCFCVHLLSLSPGWQVQLIASFGSVLTDLLFVIDRFSNCLC